jgi:uncharacterized protein YkwD
MTPIRAPKAARALLATVAGGVLLAGCGSGAARVQGAAAAVPTKSAAPAAAPVARPSTPSNTGTPRRTSRPPAKSGTTHRTVRAAPTPARTTPAPTHRRPRGTTVKPTPGRPTSTNGLTSDEAQVLALVDKERASAGCGALRSNAILVSVARAHSQDMAVHGYFDHTSQDGRSPFDRMRAAGYKGGLMGENIAAGQPTPAAVMDAWMHSPGHRANILNCGYKAVGIGVSTVDGSPYRIYWTQDFGDR